MKKLMAIALLATTFTFAGPKADIAYANKLKDQNEIIYVLKKSKLIKGEEKEYMVIQNYLLQNAKDDKEAIIYIENANKAEDYKNPTNLGLLAMAYKAVNNDAKYDEVYKIGANLPNKDEFFFDLAGRYQNQKNFDKATAFYNKVLKYSKSVYLKTLSYENLALINTKDASKYLKEAYNISKDNKEALTALASFYSNALADYNKSLELFNDLNSKYKNDEGILISRINIANNMKNMDLIVKYTEEYKKAFNIQKYAPLAYVNMQSGSLEAFKYSSDMALKNNEYDVYILLAVVYADSYKDCNKALKYAQLAKKHNIKDADIIINNINEVLKKAGK